MKKSSISKSLIAQAVKVIESGGVITFPTDTFYALGVNPFNSKAVEKIFKIKGRTFNKPLGLVAGSFEGICMATGLDELAEYIKPVTNKFWPGPLTIVLPVSEKLAAQVSSGTNTVACRIPSCNSTLELLQSINPPLLTSTSANISGGVAPVCPDEMPALLKENVDFILDLGRTPGESPSTIIKFENRKPVLLREGCVEFNEIEKLYK